jgi:hypothetical protein
MEPRRKQYAAEIRLEIIRMEKSQKRDEEVLENLHTLGLRPDVVNKKRDEIRAKMDKRTEQIFEYTEKERDYLSGKFDEEIISQYNTSKKTEKTRKDDMIAKRRKNLEDDEIKKEKMEEKRYKDNEDKYIEKNYKYYYKQFCKAEETLPTYIRANLDDMPNNKGYIWRGCWFFGNKKREYNSPLIMFEKQRGGVLYINEIDDREHRLFEKRGKERKTLVSKKLRKYRLKV